MVDLHPVLAELLEDIAPVELAFPSTDAVFPVITITELGNSAFAVYDDEERLSDHEWQFDVWDNANTPQRCQQLAAAVNQRLTDRGIRRHFGQLMRDPSGLQRYCMRARFRLDEHTFFVYRS